jgi:hypothetical protein
MTNEEREQYWRDQISKWSASGVSQVQFCKDEGLNLNTFVSWKSLMKKRDAKAQKSDRRRQSSPTFAKVKLVHESEERQAPSGTPSALSGQGIVAAELTKGQDLHLKIFNGADRSTLVAIFTAWSVC